MPSRLPSAFQRIRAALRARTHGRPATRRTQQPGNTWLWVVRDAPTTVRDVGDRGWWTCDPATREGDEALIYRTAPNKDIAYLVRATSDAFDRTPDDGVPSSLPTACDYVVVARFTEPLELADLRSDPQLAGWTALRINFRGAAHPVPPDVRERLLARLGVSADRLLDLADDVLLDYWFERDIEKQLVRAPQRFTRAGLGDIVEVTSQKHFANGRIADLVLTLSSGDAVVVELKRERVRLDAVHQLEDYQNCYRAEIGGRRPPRGLLVGTELTPEARAALRQLPGVAFMSLQELGFRRLPARPPVRAGE